MLILSRDQVFYFLHLQRDLLQEELDQLQKLLNAKITTIDDKQELVIPRKATISPWSSKATDVLKICGFPIIRIERGRIDVSFDKMTERISKYSAQEIFPVEIQKKSLQFLEWKGSDNPLQDLEKVNVEWGLALSRDEMEYLVLKSASRNLTDAELFMFAQVNSEHCRHKIFKSSWEIDGEFMEKSLFDMIRNTFEKNSSLVLSAYSDNAAVLQGQIGEYFGFSESKKYQKIREAVNMLIKVETHNHPTAVSPFPGAATGSGGEIRDEGIQVYFLK